MAQISRNDWIAIMAAAVLYYCLARFGMLLFSLKPSNITLLWLPSGLGMVMCLRWGRWAVPFIVLASFAANYPGMSNNNHALLYTGISALADGMAGGLSMLLWRRFVPGGLSRTHDLALFGWWVCLVPTTLTSTILILNLLAGGYIDSAASGALFGELMLGDSLGIILVYQVYEGWRTERMLHTRQWQWLAGAGLLNAALLLLSFTSLPGAVFCIVPVLVVLSFNVVLLGVAALSSLSLIAVIAATAHHLGPFAGVDVVQGNFALMAFTFSSALTVLGISMQNRYLLVTERNRQQWQSAAEHDPLSGLLNRRAFMPRLQSEHLRAIRTGRPYTVAMLDLDHFKHVNDSYGHQLGDEVICVLARIMQTNCRAIDSIGRLGGEEFAVLFPESTAHEAEAALERIRKEFSATPVLSRDGARVFVTVSVGLATFSSKYETESDLLAQADRALYAAKAAGRDRIVMDVVLPA